MSNKAWGGRFDEELDAIAARFSASVDVDGRLWEQDIDSSIAHVRMLAGQKIVSTASFTRMRRTLTHSAGVGSLDGFHQKNSWAR